MKIKKRKVCKQLNELYKNIYIEAYYDLTTKESQEFARKLLPLIEKLNDILGFKK